MEDVKIGYITETMARVRREGEEHAEEVEEHTLMQGRKLKRGAGRRREGKPARENQEEDIEEQKPTTSSTPPGPSTTYGGEEYTP